MKSKTLLKIAFLCLIAGSFLINFNKKEISGYSTLETVVKEEAKNMSLYFCEKDDCSAIIKNEIDNSNRVDCALYDVDLENVITSLTRKPYRLVVDDGSNVKISHREDNNNQLMHNKFCALDTKIISGSFNPKKNSLFKDYNNLIVIESDYLVKNYEAEFEELWNNTLDNKVKYPLIDYGNTRIENYFCPEDDCKGHLLNLLNDANEINFLIFSFTDKDISNKLIERYNSGSIVKGVVEKQRINMQYEQGKYLRQNLIDVKVDSNPYLLHDKTWIINNEIIVIGSYNPTSAANTKNDENILIIHNKELANKMKLRFEEIYSKAQDF
ncbi:MAG: phospholipase D-like domain-containing protein [Candidatus Nanoarchaeia archaeon]|nr:phospholipase D-like domain-containing protein [Candidatus Nanoarchaeia archaeon]